MLRLQERAAPDEPGLVLEPSIGVFAADEGNGFFDAADLGFLNREDFHFPALALAKAEVGAKKFASKQTCLVSTGSLPDFQQHIATVVGIVR